ncbi:hypothetical protein BC829DRAFT_395216 [Chytridium lagenaria]|nr:hypothetical protein BC829DRAFT_395216 [Chytridium lagenaria]
MVPSIEMPIQSLDRHLDEQVASNALVLAPSLPMICEEIPRPTEEACPDPPPSLVAGNLDTLSRSSLTPSELEIIISSSKDVNNIEAFDLNLLSSNIPNPSPLRITTNASDHILTSMTSSADFGVLSTSVTSEEIRLLSTIPRPDEVSDDFDGPQTVIIRDSLTSLEMRLVSSIPKPDEIDSEYGASVEKDGDEGVVVEKGLPPIPTPENADEGYEGPASGVEGGGKVGKNKLLMRFANFVKF